MRRYVITIFKHDGTIYRQISDPAEWNVDDTGTFHVTIGPGQAPTEVISTSLPFVIQLFPS